MCQSYLRFCSAIILYAIVSGCSTAPITSFTLDPAVRQQLFTEQRGSRPGLLCGLETTGRGSPIFNDLDANEIQLGYKSLALPENERPRCRRNHNTEHHGAVRFDISELASVPPGPHTDLGRLTSVILSADYSFDEENEACDITPSNLLSGVIVNQNRVEITLSSDTPHRATLAPTVNIDGTPLPFSGFFRETYAATPSHINAGSGRLTITLNENLVNTIGSELRAGRGLLNVILLSPENPSWKSNHVCLSRLKNNRATLIFRADG